MGFIEQLRNRWQSANSLLCVGLDPDPARLWPDVADVAAHCRAVIDAAAPACVAVKPQLACFERLGASGWAALGETVAHARAGAFPQRGRERGAVEIGFLDADHGVQPPVTGSNTATSSPARMVADGLAWVWLMASFRRADGASCG